MMASWPGSMDWHSRKPRQFGGQMLESRGPHIPADCLIRVMPCFNSKGGFEPESTAKAHAIRELSDHRQSWINGINPLDAPVSDNVHWEVQIPGTVHDRADIIVDDNPDDVEADIYEAKQWTGPTSTFEEVEVQITRYMFMAALYGSLNWSRGRELAEAGWAVTYEAPPEPGGLGWFLERPRWVAWAFPYHGHIYFAKWRNTPEHVQVRAKRLSEDPNWYWEGLGVRIRVPVVI
jgi:hypothetical protein